MAGKTDSVTIRVPYRNLKEENGEVEMVGVDEPNHRIELNSPSSSSPEVPNGNSDISPQIPPRSKHYSLIILVLSCTVAAGVQFGWALQLSLLTPYIQVCSLCIALFSLYSSLNFLFYFIFHCFRFSNS